MFERLSRPRTDGTWSYAVVAPGRAVELIVYREPPRRILDCVLHRWSWGDRVDVDADCPLVKGPCDLSGRFHEGEVALGEHPLVGSEEPSEGLWQALEALVR